MSPMFGSPIDLSKTYIHIADGPSATALEVGEEFWQTIGGRSDLADGRLVCRIPYARDWPSWEMHPAGDELVILLSGAVDLVLEERDGERVVPLRGGQTCIVPQGVWHTARVHEASEALHITRGAGTEIRPIDSPL
jgi:mannose-6-phosphate isomerase-like protein (cupin superfamily)